MIRWVVATARAPIILACGLCLSAPAGNMFLLDCVLKCLFGKSTHVSVWYLKWCRNICIGPLRYLEETKDPNGTRRRKFNRPYYLNLHCWVAGFLTFPKLHHMGL